MSKLIGFIVGTILVVALLLFSMTYTVNFHEVAIKTRFGRTGADSVVRDAGLHFKLPLIADRITKIDKRLQLRESPLETVQTADGQQILVRAFLMWKVTESGDGPLAFHGSYPLGVEQANGDMVPTLLTAMRVGLSRYSFDDLVGSGTRLNDAEAAIQKELLALNNKGIDPVTVGISQIILPGKTVTAVLTRMQKTRTKLSESERNIGESEARGIESTARANADKIGTFAMLRAAEIKAGGDKSRQYLAEMNEEKGLAIFLAWIDTIEATLTSNTTLVLPTLFSPFHLMQLTTPLDSQGIPQPAGDQRFPFPSAVTKGASASDSTPALGSEPAMDLDAQDEQSNGDEPTAGSQANKEGP
jgi:membrane protease subunit HflC